MNELRKRKLIKHVFEIGNDEEEVRIAVLALALMYKGYKEEEIKEVLNELIKEGQIGISKKYLLF